MPIDQRSAPAAATLLRVALGIMFLAHSAWLKGVVYGLPGTAQFFAGIGLPGVLAYVVFAAEVIGGIMLVFGIQARWAALALIPILTGAVWAHAANGWVFSNQGGGWEYPLYLIVLSVAQFLLGDGRYALVASSDFSAVRISDAAVRS